MPPSRLWAQPVTSGPVGCLCVPLLPASVSSLLPVPVWCAHRSSSWKDGSHAGVTLLPISSSYLISYSHLQRPYFHIISKSRR